MDNVEFFFRKKSLINLLFGFGFITSSFSQIVINEIMVAPGSTYQILSGADNSDGCIQSMYSSTAGCGQEWVEIYNSGCTSVNIGCWSIGGMDGSLNGGVFSFPAGTTIGPRAFITLGGANSGATFNLSTYLPANGTGSLWGSSVGRWHIPNTDGWLILYDQNRAFVDGVWWTTLTGDPATKINTDASYVATMTRPSPCGGGTLTDAKTNQASMERILFDINVASDMGKTFARTADAGGTWFQDATPTRGTTNDVLVSCPLPIELISFEASLYKRQVELIWQTASELNNDYFCIERSSNGVDWKVLETIEGAGISNESLSYQTYDPYPLKGISYYRLKQTDYDGKFTYSSIESISNTEGVMVLPNPGSGLFFVSGLSERKESEILIRDITGKEIIKIHSDGLQSQAIDLSQHPGGIYFVTINSEETIRIIKLRD
jgi:hypothetical protein